MPGMNPAMVTPSSPTTERAHRIAGLTAVAFGCLGLVGWVLRIHTLQSIAPGLPAMVPNTAAAFVLAGLALLLMPAQDSRRTSGRLWTGRTFALAVAGVGIVTQCEYLFGWDPGVDGQFRLACRKASPD